MTFHVPAWSRSDPGATPRLPAPEGPPGQVVALVASEAAASAGWAPEVALELAQGWSASGVRLVLADAGLTSPSLHVGLGEAPGEGLVDALRWGASVRRVARRPEGGGFFVITSGTPVADGTAVLEDPRWPALCAGFREAGVTLAALVPSGDPCLEAVLRQAAAVVVLATPGERLPGALTGGAWPVLAVMGREAPDVSLPEPAPEPEPIAVLEPEPAPEPEPIAVLEPAPEPEPVPEPTAQAEAAVEPPPAVEAEPHLQPEVRFEPVAPSEPQGQPEPVAPMEPWPAVEPEPATDEPAAPAWSAPAWSAPVDELPGEPVPTFEEIVEEYEAASGASALANRRGLLVVALLVLVAAVLGAAWLGYVDIPGIARARGTEEPAAQDPAPTLAAPPATEISEPVPYSLGVAAFEDEAAAQAVVADLSGKVPGVLFTTAPVRVGEGVVHRVLAGPAADSAAALALGARLAESTGLDPAGWVARWTPRAFRLGEMPESEAASRRSEVLRGLGVPSYVLAVTYSDGSVRFRVYAGAYADDAEASYLSGLLQERGLSGATLSDRTGRLPE